MTIADCRFLNLRFTIYDFADRHRSLFLFFCFLFLIVRFSVLVFWFLVLSSYFLFLVSHFVFLISLALVSWFFSSFPHFAKCLRRIFVTISVVKGFDSKSLISGIDRAFFSSAGLREVVSIIITTSFFRCNSNFL